GERTCGERKALEMSGMVGNIPGLLDFHHGPYDSAEGLNEGYTHGFIMTFDSAESRDAYLPHPEHMKRVELVQPKLERLVVFDFDVTPENSAQL
ncbi:MAG: Dabb family protein, partial [Akkermansiaceae bacterium]